MPRFEHFQIFMKKRLSCEKNFQSQNLKSAQNRKMTGYLHGSLNERKNLNYFFIFCSLPFWRHFEFWAWHEGVGVGNIAVIQWTSREGGGYCSYPIDLPRRWWILQLSDRCIHRLLSFTVVWKGSIWVTIWRGDRLPTLTRDQTLTLWGDEGFWYDVTVTKNPKNRRHFFYFFLYDVTARGPRLLILNAWLFKYAYLQYLSLV